MSSQNIDMKVPVSPDSLAYDNSLILARNAELSDSDLFSVASALEGQGRPDLAVSLYRTWLANTDSASTGIAWYCLGVLLLKTQEYFLCEQAFLTAQSLSPENEHFRAALASFDFRNVNKGQDLLHSLFMMGRAGQLEKQIFLMAHERLGSAGPSQVLFELYQQTIRSVHYPNPAAYWYEFGVIAKGLNYDAAAKRAFNTALAINPAFDLPRIALDSIEGRNSIPAELLARLSLFFSPKTIAMFADLRAVIDFDVWAAFYKSWLDNSLGTTVFESCYQLGLDCQRQGKLVEAKWAFARSLKLNPDFGRVQFAIGSGASPVEYIDNRALADALEIRAGHLAAPNLPQRNAANPSEIDQLILTAPYLYRNLVLNHVQILEANEKISALSSHVSYEYETQVEQVRIATETIVCLKRKYEAFANGGIVPDRLKTGRSAFLFSWTGVGDHIYMNGAARYLATRYDKVYVATTHQHPEGIMDMYRDDPSIIWQYCKQDIFGVENYALIHSITNNAFGKDAFYTFGDNKNRPWYKFPDGYYSDYGIDNKHSFNYFHIQEFPEGEALLKIAQESAPKYIFTHTKGSNRSVFHVTQELIAREPDTLVINPDQNPYPPGHKYYDVAQKFLWPQTTATICFPIFWYIQTMTNAAELHVIDSSFWALTHYIPKSKGQKVVCYTHFDPYLVSGVAVDNFEAEFVTFTR